MAKMSAEQLKLALETLKISQGELARRLEVRPETVWRWTKGRHPIPGYVTRSVNDMLTQEAAGAAQLQSQPQ